MCTGDALVLHVVILVHGESVCPKMVTDFTFKKIYIKLFKVFDRFDKDRGGEDLTYITPGNLKIRFWYFTGVLIYYAEVYLTNIIYFNP